VKQDSSRIHHIWFINGMHLITESESWFTVNPDLIIEYPPSHTGAWEMPCSVCVCVCVLCTEVLSEQKRVKLLMQVFHSADIVRDESVAVIKFRVWWHFVVALSDKATSLFAEVSSSVLFTWNICCHIYIMWSYCTYGRHLCICLFVGQSVSKTLK